MHRGDCLCCKPHWQSRLVLYHARRDDPVRSVWCFALMAASPRHSTCTDSGQTLPRCTTRATRGRSSSARCGKGRGIICSTKVGLRGCRTLTTDAFHVPFNGACCETVQTDRLDTALTRSNQQGPVQHAPSHTLHRLPARRRGGARDGAAGHAYDGLPCHSASPSWVHAQGPTDTQSPWRSTSTCRHGSLTDGPGRSRRRNG